MCCPAHSSANSDGRKIVGIRKRILINACDLREKTSYRRRTLGSPPRPAVVIEVQVPRGYQLLQGPPSAEPPTAREVGLELLPGLNRCGVMLSALEVRKVRKTHGCPSAPLKHGVNGLGQLSAATLVDAASVDLGVFEVPQLPGKATCLLDFAPTGLLLHGVEILDATECPFLLLPCVGEDGVVARLKDELEGKCGCVEQPHCAA